jgi:hypothetical protein
MHVLSSPVQCIYVPQSSTHACRYASILGYGRCMHESRWGVDALSAVIRWQSQQRRACCVF